jgi:hypothetical protein
MRPVRWSTGSGSPTRTTCAPGGAGAALTTTQGNNGMAYTRDAAGTNTGDNAADFTSPRGPRPPRAAPPTPATRTRPTRVSC